MATRTKKKSESPAADDEAPTSLIPGLEAPPARPYTVLARRYRSRDFAEVVGQEPIARTLRNAIETGRTAHAYLFCGTRGVGKTSMARILARALNSPGLSQAAEVGDAIMRGKPGGRHWVGGSTRGLPAAEASRAIL